MAFVGTRIGVLLLAALTACSPAPAPEAVPPAPPSTIADTTTTTTTATTTTTTPPPAPPTSTSVTTTTGAARVVADTSWAPFAAVGPITLVHPSRRVERVGFHESNHDGARPLDPLATATAPVTLEGRERGTAPRTAADIVVDLALEIRAPVTGRVKRAGGYVLYCKHRDDFVVIAPDSRPAWEVKILHIDGVRVRAGDRVVAGQTVLAPRPTVLPFESQVDELRTADPAWPHVHVEVVDPAIKDRPTPGGGCP